MAFRSEAAARGLIAVAVGVAFGVAAAAAPLSFPVRHRHPHGGGMGTLTVTAAGIQFVETGKKAAHSHSWKFADLQRLELSENMIRLRTYEDVRWELGRDREFIFDRLPEGEAAKLYPALSGPLNGRLTARIAVVVAPVIWRAPAKLRSGTGGANGELEIGDSSVVFDAAGARAPRTWRYSDIRNISSADPYDLTVTSHDGETRFQLKQPLSEERFNELWRRISEANGLRAFDSRLPTSSPARGDDMDHQHE